MKPELTWKNYVFFYATLILAFSWPFLAVYWSVFEAALLCTFNYAFLNRFGEKLADALASVLFAWKFGSGLSLLKKYRLARWYYYKNKAFEIYKRAFYDGKSPRRSYDEARANQITLSDL